MKKKMKSSIKKCFLIQKVFKILLEKNLITLPAANEEGGIDALLEAATLYDQAIVANDNYNEIYEESDDDYNSE